MRDSGVASRRLLEVTLVRSTIGQREQARRTARALGLRKIGATRVHWDTRDTLGQIRKIEHLVEVRHVFEPLQLGSLDEAKAVGEGHSYSSETLEGKIDLTDDHEPFRVEYRKSGTLMSWMPTLVGGPLGVFIHSLGGSKSEFLAVSHGMVAEQVPWMCQVPKVCQARPRALQLVRLDSPGQTYVWEGFGRGRGDDRIYRSFRPR